MKKIVTIILIFQFVFIVKLDAQKNAEYVMPEDSTAESSKKEFIKQFKQGKILYNISCAQCHTVKEGGKEIIPDFSMPQLLDYEMRFYYPEHQERLTDTKITDEEMTKIILFLKHKKKSGRPIHP
jgi:mono/diheme cytochrome c family protein